MSVKLKTRLIVSIVLISLGLTGCASTSKQPVMDPSITVQVQKAQKGTLELSESYIGTVSDAEVVSVIPQVSGNVTQVMVKVGDCVSAGDFLCQFDDTTAKLDLAKAKAGYDSAVTSLSSAQSSLQSAEAGYDSSQASYKGAQAGYSNAEANYDSATAKYNHQKSGEDQIAEEEGTSKSVLEEQLRVAENKYEAAKSLLDAGAASQSEVDSAYNEVLAARANIQSAKAGISSAKANIDSAQSSVESAQAGVKSAKASVESAKVGIESAEKGIESAQNSVDAATYQLGLHSITAPISGVVQEVNVTSHNAYMASSGQAAVVITNPATKTITFYVTDEVAGALQQGESVTVTNREKKYKGSISEVGVAADEQSGLFKVKATVYDAEKLKNGVSVELNVVAHSVKDRLLVPSDSIYFEDNDAYVYTVAGDQAVKTRVEVALYDKDTIAIQNGLEEGQEVITTWAAGLRDGVTIKKNKSGEEKQDGKTAPKDIIVGKDSQSTVVAASN